MRLIDFVLQTPNEKWSWVLLSQNPNITFNDIMRHPHLPWAFYTILKNSSLTLSQLDVIYRELWSTTLELVLDLMVNNMPVKTTKYLSANQSIPLEWFLHNKHKYDWFWYHIAQHPQLTINIVRNHPELRKEQSVPNNIHIPFNDLVDWIHERNYNSTPLHLSCHPHVGINEIFDHPELSWHWYTLSVNPNITPSIVKKYGTQDGCYWVVDKFFQNQSFDLETLYEILPTKTFQDSISRSLFSLNRGLSYHTIEQYPSFDWCDPFLSKNAGLTVKELYNHRHQHRWNYGELSSNYFNHHTNMYDYTIHTMHHWMEQTMNTTNKYKDELIASAWRPERMKDWCLDVYERNELEERWNL